MKTNRFCDNLVLCALMTVVTVLAGCGSDDAARRDAREASVAPDPEAHGRTGRIASPAGVLRPDAQRIAAARVQPDVPATRADAARFLEQATFGATDAGIDRVMQLGYAAWINEQLAMAGNRLQPRMDYYRTLDDGYFFHDRNQLHYSAWYWASITGQDQLRQRMAFALSEIFVVSYANAEVRFNYEVMPYYYDMLLKNAFANYRTLLEEVTLHPGMGLYLSHRANAKDDAATGARPDENFAREVMQLFSIGLWELNRDGSRKLQNGQPIPTYGKSDVEGLAKVFTGWSWGNMRPDWKNNEYGFYSNNYAYVEGLQTLNTPMEEYPVYHSTSQKTFLGTTVPAQTTPDPRASLKAAMDRLSGHPNVGPFLARQLIQRFVTSNPSPGYVSRVAGTFDDNGSGVRGDLGAVIKAVLLDAEARDPAMISVPSFGKLREPLLRMTNAARAFRYRSEKGGRWLVTTNDPWFLHPDPPGAIDQLPFDQPSVFNWFRPGYVPANSELSANGLVGPEYQIFNEVTTVNWVNALEHLVYDGMGHNWYDNPFTWDITSSFAPEAALADRPDALIDRIASLLMGGRISTVLRADVREAIQLIPMTETDARDSRARLAVFLIMSSPEYLVQK